MSVTAEEPIIQASRWQRFLAHVPSALAIVVAVLTLVGFAVGLALLAGNRVEWGLWGGGILGLAGLLVLGIGLSGLLMLISRLVRQMAQLSDRTNSLDQRTAILAEQAVARGQKEVEGAPRRLDPELRALLLEVRDTLLLPEPAV